MISRRNFLKLSGLAAAALGSGYTAGKIMNSSGSEFFRVQAYLPGSEAVSLLSVIIGRKMNHPRFSLVTENTEIREAIEKSLAGRENISGNQGSLIIRIDRAGNAPYGDILISDSRRGMYNPAKDFTGDLLDLRAEIRKHRPDFLFTAEYSNESFLSSLFRGGKSIVVIEDENGIYDKIDPGTGKKEIFINGPAGRTGILLAGGSVSIVSSSCRNKQCIHTGRASKPGSIIACAPNKVLIHIDKV